MAEGKQRTALVTGGSRGIGSAACKALADAGYRVAATYIDVERTPADDESIRFFRWDVGDYEQCLAGVAEVESALGPIDVLVNNAGITRDASMPKMTHADWTAVIQTNLDGPFNMSSAIFPGMCRRGWGRVINIGSINAQAGQFGQVNYAAAKAGLQGMTKSLALEGARKGVTANLVAPGYIGTDMVRQMKPEILEQIVARIPMGRLGTPEEVAGVIVYLASESAGFVTGSTISINGGQHIA